MAAELSGLTRRVFQPPPERAAALLEKRNLLAGQGASPAGVIRPGSRDGESRLDAPSRVEPAESESREEVLTRSAAQTLFVGLPPRLAGEENEETRRHPPSSYDAAGRN